MQFRETKLQHFFGEKSKIFNAPVDWRKYFINVDFLYCPIPPFSPNVIKVHIYLCNVYSFLFHYIYENIVTYEAFRIFVSLTFNYTYLTIWEYIRKIHIHPFYICWHWNLVPILLCNFLEKMINETYINESFCSRT